MDDKPPVRTLRVQSLGLFRVFLGEEPVPAMAWSREKARHLFQYFVTYAGQLRARERLTSDLWPSLDARRAERDFKVAFNALNDALSPERPARSLAPYFLRQGTSYGLDREAPIAIDYLLLEEGVRTGGAIEGQDPRQAIELYQAALSQYQGEYLPDTIYQDWSSSLRERLATIYLTTAGRLARLLSEEGRTVESILWSEKVLAIDPCWEEAYRLLMKAYLVDGNRPLAIRTYQRCRQALADELGLEPMVETDQLYQMALGRTTPL